MISRYTRPEMGAIWSDENKFQKWLDVEIATAEAEAEAGLIPKSAARAIRRKGRVDVKRILEIEKEVKHDVIAFTTNVAEHVGREARYLHFGLTSNDVVDTAQGLLIKDASKLLLEDLELLAAVLKKRAFEFKHTPMVGRTHGIHAEPITFGVKIAIWYAECRRNHERLAYAAEQICGLARVVRANAQAAFENVALWHERDISHSSVERVILPDSTILVDYMLNRTTNLVEKMFVYPERMQENLDLLKGLIFSGQLLLDLTEKGVSREEAYRWVQRNAMQVWKTREDFKSLVQRDPDISGRLSAKEIAAVFNTKRYLKHVDEIFRQVFGR